MSYTIQDIQEIAVPIVKKYGVKSLSLFGSYARGEATDDSDLDFFIDKDDLRGLFQYFSLVNDLENSFNCHVDLITTGINDEHFLNKIHKDEIVLYERRGWVYKRIIYYCNRLDNHVQSFGDDKDIFLVNEQYQDACALIFIQIGEFVGRLSLEFKQNHADTPWQSIKNMRNIYAHNYESIMFDVVWETIQEDIPKLKKYLVSLVE